MRAIFQYHHHQPYSLGFTVWGLRFGVWGLRFGVWGLGFGVYGLGFGVWGLGFRFRVGGWGLELCIGDGGAGVCNTRAYSPVLLDGRLPHMVKP
jgi:hypothetical protein